MQDVKTPHDTVVQELRVLADKTKVDNVDLAMAIAVYLLGFSSYSGFSSLIEGESEYEENFLKRICTYAKILQ